MLLPDVNKLEPRLGPHRSEEQQKKSAHVFRCPVYPGLPFRASVLIFEVVAQKTELFGREDLFFLVFTNFWGTRANP